MRHRIIKIVTLSLLFLAVTACQKTEDDRPLDYSVQVIPDIAMVLQGHEDLIEAMNSIDQLFFGDQPPKLFTIGTTEGGLDTITGFYGMLVFLDFLPSTPEHINLNPPNGGDYHFRFHDQHRGIAKFDYENTRPNANPNLPSTTSYTHVTDSVFIMGYSNLFTAYFILKQEVKGYENNGTTLAVILSGEVQEDGIHNFHYGYKIIKYDNSPIPQYSHINDIYLYKKDFMPFVVWEPDQTNNEEPE